MSRRTVKAVALVIVGCCVCGFAAAEGVSVRIERGAESPREITETFRPVGLVTISTTSGDIRLDHMSGRIDIRTASGDIDLDGVRGTVMLGSASGDVEVAGLHVDAESGFSSASGDVNVRLAESPVHDLTLSSASGRATLDYAGNRVEGRVEFTALVNRGRINSPFGFDQEETFSRSGQLYARKSFTRGRSTPQITVGTASGTAELKR